MKNFFDTVVHGLQHFSLRDYAMYELCVFSGSVALVGLFPELLIVDTRAYIAIFIVSISYVCFKIGEKNRE